MAFTSTAVTAGSQIVVRSIFLVSHPFTGIDNWSLLQVNPAKAGEWSWEGEVILERRWSDVSLGVRMKRSLGKTSYVFSYVFLMKHMFPFTSFVSRQVCLSPPSTQVIPSIELCRLGRPTHGAAPEVFLDHGTDEGTIFAGLMYAAYPWYKATGELYICQACARNLQSCLALCGHEL